MTIPNEFRPGCFGSAFAFVAESRECRGCPFASDCAPQASASLANIRDKFGVSERTMKVRTITADPTPRPIPGLPKKVGEFIQRHNVQADCIHETLRRGENPFLKSSKFLTVTCQLLLRQQAGVTRDVLCYAFQRAFNWSKGTASAHALQAVQLLRYFKVIEETDGVIRLKVPA